MITISHLYKYFGATPAINDLSLQINEGEIFGLVGPDGAGKTTTLRLLCGALSPSRSAQGQRSVVLIDGKDMLQHPDEARAQIGYLAQRFSLYEELTVMENLRFFAEVRGMPGHSWRSRSMEILRFVDLDAYVDRRAGLLSGGMKQKLGLAVALVHRPKVLLLDEPTTGVDPVTRQDFWQLIIRLVGEEKVTVLVSTPYMDEAARCGRIGFLMQGRLLVEGTPEVLRSRLRDRVVELRGRPLPLLRQIAQQDADVQDVHLFGDRIHLRVAPGQTEAVIDRLIQSLPSNIVDSFRVRAIQPQLEDIFMSLVEENR